MRRHKEHFAKLLLYFVQTNWEQVYSYILLVLFYLELNTYTLFRKPVMMQ